MESLDLLNICTSAFAMVFMLLALLAVVMWVITAIFPQKTTATDTAVLAAVASMVANVYPGTRISKIEEIK